MVKHTGGQSLLSGRFSDRLKSRESKACVRHLDEAQIYSSELLAEWPDMPEGGFILEVNSGAFWSFFDAAKAH